MRIFFILTFVLSSADHIHLVQVASLSRVILFIGGYHGEEAMPEAHRICERTTARYGQACLNYLLFDEDEAKIALQATLSPGGDRHNTFVFELAAGFEQFPEVWGASDPGNLRPIADRLNVLIQPSVVLRHNYTDLVVDVHDADFPVLRGMGTLLMELPIERAVIETSTASMHGNQALNEIVGLVMQNAGFICVEG